MSTGRQRRPGLKFPGLAAEQDQVEQLVVADLQGAGDRTQLIGGLGDVSVLQGCPFRDLHTGQAGGLLDGQTDSLRAVLMPRPKKLPQTWRRSSGT